MTRRRFTDGAWLWSIPLIAALLLAVAGAWSYLWLQRSLKERVGDTLRTVLRADVQALTFWLESQAAAIESTSRQPGVLSASRALLRMRDLDAETLRNSPAAAEWSRHIAASIDNLHPAGYALLDLSGRLLASSSGRYVGVRVPINRSLLSRLTKGESVFEPPHRHSVDGRPMLAVATGIPCEDGRICGLLAYRQRPEEELTRLLNIARPGQSGETYAFDEHGYFVSDSRFLPQLRALGLAPKEGSSVLAIALRDPGVDLTTGAKAALPRESQPLTRPAAEALAGREGFDVEGYRDYRGVLCVGAWTWLEKYGMGIATEVDLDEAYAPLVMMRRALVMPLALVVLATVLAFIVSAKAQALRLSLAKSERRAQQTVVELSAVNKELEAFSYSVSHDLRAPLRHIMGFVDLLKRRLPGQLDETSAAHLTVIGEAASRMNALIDDLLAFSQTSRTDMHQTAVDLDELAREAIAEVGREARGRNIDWRVGPLPVVRGDRAMLRIALVNLLSNAVKYTQPRARAVIEVGVQPPQVAQDDQPQQPLQPQQPPRPDQVVLFVRDNGIGFDMRYADQLFGVFQRLHRAEEFEGHGIGLATVRRIIHRHGGRTWAEARPDAGATFFCTLSTP
jgi:signal transduction histidine kinase